MTELKNCPFCGGECAVSHLPYRGTGASGMETPWPFVICNQCGLRSAPVQCDDSPYGKRTKAKSYKSAKAEAVTAWNARADGWIAHDAGPCPVALDAHIRAVGPDPMCDQFEGIAADNNWGRTRAYKLENRHD